MKTTTFLLVASFVLASSLLSTPCGSVDLSTPVAAWSGSSASEASPVLHSNTVLLTELAESLLGLLGLSSPSSSLFSSLESSPELAVFFVEPMLSTHSFYQLTGAYNPSPRVQPVFAGVRSQLESKKSVLAENVVLYTELTNILSALAARQLTAHITSSVLIVGPANDELSLTLLASFPHQARHITTDQLEAFLLANPALASNGVTDIIIYRFADSLLHTHDAIIDSLSTTIDSLTKDSFFFLGSQATPDLPFANSAPHYSRIAETNNTDQSNATNGNYTTQFPPNVASGLITTAFLLIILAIGVCCLCYTQTPDRFPEAIREGQTNYHLLYPAKQ